MHVLGINVDDKQLITRKKKKDGTQAGRMSCEKPMVGAQNTCEIDCYSDVVAR